MKRLDLHILGDFLRYFLYTLAAFILLFIAGSLFDELSAVLRYNASMFDAMLMVLARTPEMLVMSLPLATLISSVATVTIMTRAGETTALRASGIPLSRIARPLVVGGLLVASLHLVLSEYVVPVTYALGQEIRTVRIQKKPPRSLVREANVWFRFGEAFVHADKIAAADKSMSGVTVYERKGADISRTLTASKAKWNGTEWVLESVVTRTFATEGGWTEEKTPALPYPVFVPPDELSVIKVEPQYASMATLAERARSLKNQGVDVTALRVEHAKKLAFPFASLLMPLLALPFAIRATHRSGLWMGVAYAMIAGFAYMAAVLALSSLGKLGTMPPHLAAWLATLIFAPAGIYMLRRAEHGS